MMKCIIATKKTFLEYTCECHMKITKACIILFQLIWQMSRLERNDSASSRTRQTAVSQATELWQTLKHLTSRSFSFKHYWVNSLFFVDEGLRNSSLDLKHPHYKLHLFAFALKWLRSPWHAEFSHFPKSTIIVVCHLDLPSITSIKRYLISSACTERSEMLSFKRLKSWHAYRSLERKQSWRIFPFIERWWHTNCLTEHVNIQKTRQTPHRSTELWYL